MSAARKVAGAMVPDSTMSRVHMRVALDAVVMVAIALLAVGFVLGYQVLVRWGHRIPGLR